MMPTCLLYWRQHYPNNQEPQPSCQ
jgi:hypothetical protein